MKYHFSWISWVNMKHKFKFSMNYESPTGFQAKFDKTTKYP